MKPHALLLAFLALATPAAAHADWDFGETVWLEGSSGLGGFTGIEEDTVSLTVRSTIGFRVDDDYGVELGFDGAFDPIAGLAAGGGSVLFAWFPETDAVRLRAGPRLRHFSIDPGVWENGLFCFDACQGYTGGESTDLGIEIGALSQWNLGPFFFSIEWFGLYQPLIALDTAYVHHRGDGTEWRSKADWHGVELPAEVRFLTLGGGLTF